MTTLNILFNASEKTERFPVYCKYPGQFNAQPAFITLDLEDGDIDADYTSEIGNAVPARVWHGIVIRFAINPQSTADQIEQIINDNAEAFQQILDGADVVWDGNNYVGKLNAEAQEVYERLDDYGNGFCCDHEGGMIDDLGEWLDGRGYLPEGKSFDEYAQDLLDCDGDNGYFFSSSFNDVDSMKSELLDLWADALYSGDDIPANVAKLLIDNHTCDDSEWMEELREFANA
jgi:hypothetical protein